MHAESDGGLPVSAVDALTAVTTSSPVSGTLVRGLVSVAGCALLALILGAVTLRRQTP